MLTEELDGLVNTTGTHAAGMAHLVVDQTASDGDGGREVDWFSSFAHHRARELYLAHHGGWFPSIKTIR